jgi:hypothetical protein
MPISDDDLREEWESIPKDWYSIYNWKRVTGQAYLETIAGWMLDEWDGITLNVEGCRRAEFRQSSHSGRPHTTTQIKQVTEKRIVQAAYNLGKLPLLGEVLDYEVPLADKRGSSHGDVDLLCWKKPNVYIVEAKNPRTSDAILKPLLQAYVYASLVAKSRDTFLDEYSLPREATLVPSVLVHQDSAAARQLGNAHTFPETRKLLLRLGQSLNEKELASIECFVLTTPREKFKNCLSKTADGKVVFGDRSMIELKQLEF